MIYEEALKKRKLKHRQEDLLESIVELKKLHRAKIILLNNQIKYLNRMADKVCDAGEDKLEKHVFKLNQLFQNIV